MMDGSLNKLRKYFESGATQSYSFRKKQLEKLKDAILKYEKDLYKALHDDLKKSPEESWVTELGLVLSDIRMAMKNLRQWMEPERVPTNLMNLPSSSYVMKEPMGVALIIAPWNYPFQLLINPLVGAIAAGNCVVLKASEYASATDAVMKKMIEETFSDEYILYVQGIGAKVVPEMMDRFTFDLVFYTGSTAVGKIVYKMAAEKLTPVILELGGKSPCVIESDANIKVAARRIGITKFSAAGQMCVAPDYVLVHTSVKEKFIGHLKESLLKFFSDRPESSYDYCRIVNEKQFDRLAGYLKDGRVIYGGRTDRSKLFIEPTILDHVSADAPVMKEEIFGPILPVIPFETMEEAKSIIQQNPDPLSFYIYTGKSSKEKEWLTAVPAGSACVNNSSWHFTNHHLPFGGRGSSGIGLYHGRYSFDAFSHRKAVMKTPAWFDPAIKYPPFRGKLKLLKKLVR